DRVPMDLERSRPVFERVLLSHRLRRKLAGLADRDDAGAEVVRNRSGQDETAGLDPDDLVDVPAAEVHDDQVDDRRIRDRIGEDRRDVLEDDARLGEVRDVADQGLDLLDLHGSYLRLRLADGRRFWPGRGRVPPPWRDP